MKGLGPKGPGSALHLATNLSVNEETKSLVE